MLASLVRITFSRNSHLTRETLAGCIPTKATLKAATLASEAGWRCGATVAIAVICITGKGISYRATVIDLIKNNHG